MSYNILSKILTGCSTIEPGAFAPLYGAPCVPSPNAGEGTHIADDRGGKFHTSFSVSEMITN